MRLRLTLPRLLRSARRIAALAVGTAIFATAPSIAAADLEDVVARGVLRVGLIATDAPPLVQTDANGAPSGLEGDFIAEVARRMDVQIQFVRTATTPDELVAQVAGGQIDVGIGQLTDSLEWAKSVRFSRPYMELHEIRLVDRLAATRAGGSASLLATAGAQVISVAGSIVLPALQEEFADRLTVLPTLDAAVDAVLAGRAVAVIADDIAISRWLAANPAAGLRLELVTRRDRRPGLAMAMNWKSDDLQAWLNLCIEKCALDGTLEALATKYLGGHRP